MLNHVTMMGRLTADPELRRTQSGISVTSFRIAVDRNYADQEGEVKTDFFDVCAWRSVAEIVCKYCSKGRMIAIDGRLETREWQDRDGHNRVSVGIVAESVFFADSKREREERTEEAQPAENKSASKGKGTGRTGGRGRKAA